MNGVFALVQFLVPDDGTPFPPKNVGFEKFVGLSLVFSFNQKAPITQEVDLFYLLLTTKDASNTNLYPWPPSVLDRSLRNQFDLQVLTRLFFRTCTLEIHLFCSYPFHGLRPIHLYLAHVPT